MEKAIWESDHGWSENVPVRLGPNETPPEIRLELLEGGTIEGQVIGLDGAPAEGELIAASDGLGVLIETHSVGGGRFRFERLRPGRYLLDPLGRQPGRLQRLGGAWGFMQYYKGSQNLDDPFERPVLVKKGELARWDIDLRRDALGAIDGEVTEDLPEEAVVFFGRIVDGSSHQGDGLGGSRSMAHRRFRLDLLRPGPYRVWLYNSGGRWAEADVDVKPAGITKLVLRRPKATLLIPIAGNAAEGIEDLKVLRAERRASLDFKGEWIWEAWRGYRVSQEPGAVKIEGLPPGLVRVSVIAFGFRLAWTETVRLAEGRETSAPLLTLIPGRAIRVRIERPDGGPIPDEVRFFASRDDLWPDLSQRRVLGEPIWILSGLSPGSFEVSASALNDLEGEVSVTVPEDRDIETTIQLKPR